MSPLTWIVIGLAVVATVAVVWWFATARQVPERAAGHRADPADRQDPDESGRGVQPGDVVERPAGPGAESQRPDGRGPLRPGP